MIRWCCCWGWWVGVRAGTWAGRRGVRRVSGAPRHRLTLRQCDVFLNRIVRQHVRGKLPPRAESLLVEIPPLIQRCQRNGVAVLPHILSKLVKLVPSHSDAHRLADVALCVRTAVRDEFACLSGRDVAILLHSLAKTGSCDREFFDRAVARLVDGRQDAQLTDLTVTMWAAAHLGYRCDRLADVVARRMIADPGQMNARNVSLVVWAFAKLNVMHRDLFHAMAERASAIATKFDAQAISNTAWAYAVMRIHNDVLFDVLAGCAIAKVRSLAPQHVANASWAFATLSVRNGDLFAKLSHQATATIDLFTGQHLSNTAWAFAKLGLTDHDLFSAIGRASVAIIDTFDAQAFATTAWAFSSLNIEDADLFDVIGRRSADRIDAFNAASLATVANAYASLGIVHVDLFDAIARRSLGLIDSLTGHDLGNILWSFARLGLGGKHKDLFHSATSRLVSIVSTIQPPALTNLACAFTSAGMLRNDLAGDLLVQRAIVVISDFKPQDLSRMAWAISRCTAVNLDLFTVTLHRCVAIIDLFDAENLIKLIEALAPVAVMQREFLRRVAQRATNLLDTFSPGQLARIASTFSEARVAIDKSGASVAVKDAELFGEIQRRTVARCDEFLARDLSMLTFALASVCAIGDHALLDAVTNRVSVAPDTFSPPDLAQVAWAFAVADHTVPEEVVVLVKRVFASTPGLDAASRRLLQDWQVSLQEPRSAVIPCPMQDELASHDLLADVIHLLQQVCTSSSLEEGVSCPDTGFVVDVAIRDTRLAVEMNGACRFSQDIATGHLGLNGRTQLKHRLLRQHGWTVVNVNFHEWANLQDESDKARFLTERLPTAIGRCVHTT
ncbi:RAP domain-containing protein [Plasmodiophora brassicae]|uniref:RAP domain-containing protein n=1 Tax=Plasmodiophora brassicae TaxID=37360 RepID=A0A0G4IGZ6_PLABS|nr:hypothetical protein PBRA_000132 [Plasmodiophora brassicae]